MGMGNGMGMGMNGNLGDMSGSERAFMSALQASGATSSTLTLLVPQNMLQNVLIPRGIMQEISQKSGCAIDLGAEGPGDTRQVTVRGSMVANSLAALYLQEKVIQI